MYFNMSFNINMCIYFNMNLDEICMSCLLLLRMFYYGILFDINSNATIL